MEQGEVACADGLPGVVIEFETTPKITPKTVLTCTQATPLGGGCKLPGNTKPS